MKNKIGIGLIAFLIGDALAVYRSNKKLAEVNEKNKKLVARSKLQKAQLKALDNFYKNAQEMDVEQAVYIYDLQMKMLEGLIVESMDNQ